MDVTNQAKQVATATWKVTVPLAPITIAAQEPQGNVQGQVGADTELKVTAKVGDRRDMPLSYRWFVNGKAVPTATASRFVYRINDDREATRVQVVVSAVGRKSDAATWNLRPAPTVVAAVPPAVAVPPAAAVPPRAAVADAPPAARPPDMAQIQDWIESYRSAYQSKNVDRLVALGVIPADERDHMKRVFGDLDDLHVEISNPSIKFDSDDSATVTFARTDTFTGMGTPEMRIGARRLASLPPRQDTTLRIIPTRRSNFTRSTKLSQVGSWAHA